MLYREIKRGEVLSVVIGEWNCSGWIKYMGVDEPEMIYTRPVSAR